jgi:hypothetical protein
MYQRYSMVRHVALGASTPAVVVHRSRRKVVWRNRQAPIGTATPPRSAILAEGRAADPGLHMVLMTTLGRHGLSNHKLRGDFAASYPNQERGQR